MLIVILSLSKTKEFVKEILYELFHPKGAYITAEGKEYCRNCSHNSIQFVSRTMIFVKTCRNLQRKLWQNSTLYYTVSKSKWHETFTHWSRHPLPDTFLLVLIKRVWMRLISLIADSLVCPDTLKVCYTFYNMLLLCIARLSRSSRKSVCDTPSVIHSTCNRGADMVLWRSQPRSATFCDVMRVFLHLKA